MIDRGLIARLRAARDEYTRLGFDTLPLKPGTKVPIHRSWQTQDPSAMWNHAPADSNIAVRCDGLSGVAVIDCDEKDSPGTVQYLRRYLQGLGLRSGDYPLIKTASVVGRHIYVTATEVPPGNVISLSLEVGAGDFRYGPGAYVVAPPSIVLGNQYHLLEGDFKALPTVKFVDLRPILNIASIPTGHNLNVVSQGVPEIDLRISENAMDLLQGKGVRKFKSRSEAEQALLLSLINSGHAYESIEDLFLKHPAFGKFRELYNQDPENAFRWLRLSYEEALEYGRSHESPECRMAKEAITWAQSRPWPGGTGAYDRVVFIAHAEISANSGKRVYSASSRELAERAGCSAMTASTATKRLIRDGWIEQVGKAIKGIGPYRYRLGEVVHTLTLPHSIDIRECKGLHSHDVFRWGGLNKSGAEVWQELLKGPRTEDELASLTGRHISTIRRVLGKMKSVTDPITGELHPMVRFDEEKWHALPVDLDEIARYVGTAGKRDRQKEQHKLDRQRYQRNRSGQGNLPT